MRANVLLRNIRAIGCVEFDFDFGGYRERKSSIPESGQVALSTAKDIYIIYFLIFNSNPSSRVFFFPNQKKIVVSFDEQMPFKFVSNRSIFCNIICIRLIYELN